MDKDRQIRFLYPPLIFLSSIALGIWLDPSDLLRKTISTFFNYKNNADVFVALLGASSLVLVLGFLIGTLTVFFLRFLFSENGFNYEIKLKNKLYKQIGDLILDKKDDSITKEERFYAGVVFDHNFIAENIHRWIIRRWNAFFISSSSTIALFLSLLVGYLLKVTFTYSWILTILSFAIIFIIQACFSYIETMRMIEFMIKVKNKEKTNIY